MRTELWGGRMLFVRQMLRSGEVEVDPLALRNHEGRVSGSAFCPLSSGTTFDMMTQHTRMSLVQSLFSSSTCL